METAQKLLAAAVVCCVACVLFQKRTPELALLLSLLTCALVLVTALPLLSPVMTLLRRLESLTGLSGAVFAPLLKVAAIGLLSQLTGAVCRDSGQQALAQAVELGTGFVCLYLALPLFEMVLSLLQTMIGG